MNPATYIAKRYLLAKKSHNLINIITLISVLGVGVGTFALIVVLSVFNGFEKVITGMITAVTPDLLVEPVKGKQFPEHSIDFQSLESLAGAKRIVKVIEEDALFRHGDQQHIGRLKGVSEAYQTVGHFDSMMVSGQFQLYSQQGNFAVVGAGVAWVLGINPRNPAALLSIYVPQRGNPSTFSPDQAFEFRSVNVSGVFNTKQDIDERLVLVPLSFASELLHYQDEITSVEIFTQPGSDPVSLQKKVKTIVGVAFTVKDRFEQQETLYRIMHSEKWAIFIILSFILVMATFNVIGSLTMLIVDKQKDIHVLNHLGASPAMVRRLFLTEGIFISMSGGLLGLFFGIVLVLLQQYFGFLQLGSESGTFVIDDYPVQLQFVDVVGVLLLVISIGTISSVYTVKKVVKRIQEKPMGQEEI